MIIKQISEKRQMLDEMLAKVPNNIWLMQTGFQWLKVNNSDKRTGNRCDYESRSTLLDEVGNLQVVLLKLNSLWIP